jgi:hypothetical protein
MLLATGVLTTRTMTAQSAAVAAPARNDTSWTLDRHLELVSALREQTGVSANWKPKRTAWGHPDFEGSWTSDAAHGVPRDRPAQFGHRMFLNDAEFADRVARETKTGNGAVKYAMSGARKYEAAVADAKAKGLPPPEPSSSVHEDVAR